MTFRIKRFNVHFYETLIGIYMYEHVCFSRHNVIYVNSILIQSIT